jgi:hypothetical protein
MSSFGPLRRPILSLCGAAVLYALSLACCYTGLRADDLAPAQSPVATIGQSYEQWVAACRKLPPNRQLRGRLPSKEVLPLKTFAEFDVVLSAFLEQLRTGKLSRADHWLGEMPDKNGFFDTSRAYFQKAGGSQTFTPFAHKLSVPDGSQIFFHGDFHGDVQSFIKALQWLNEKKYLNGFRIVPPNFYMVFLGDYTDRGLFGVEVLYTLMQLKLANPERVFMARGNHEDISLLSQYGFLQEGRGKYGATFNITKIARAYDFLPVVIYLKGGANVIQCNHGGMEPGYNPRNLLASPAAFQTLGRLNQKDFLAQNPNWPGDKKGRDLAARAFQNFEPEDPVSPMVLGFMWNDFSVQASEAQFAFDPGRAFIFGQTATQTVLQNASTTNATVQAVFRAHQHSGVLNPMMRRLVASSGLFRHWQTADGPPLQNASPQQLSSVLEKQESRPIAPGSVWTFNVSPDSVYGEGCGFTFDTFGILTTAPNFESWRLQVINTQPVQ